MRENIDISDLLGKSLDADTLNLLLTEGRVKFPTKPVTSPSAISKGASNDACENDADIKNNRIKDLLQNVKDNETLVKTLEDMRDDLLKDMRIPTTGKVADAAKKLGSPNGDITKEIYDKAKVITNPDFVAISTWGYVPKLAALLGDGRVIGKHVNCSEITKAVFDGFNLAKGNIKEEDITGYGQESIKTTIDKAEESFDNKMLDMFYFILNKLFWNHIWTRMWVGIFDMTEKLIAVPIDTPIIILSSLFKFPKLTKTVYYQKGPVHKLLNKIKIAFLCRLPKRSWPPYMPEPGIQVYFRKSASDEGAMVEINGLCTSDFAKADAKCVEQFNDKNLPLDENGNITPGNGADVKDETDSLKDGMKSIFENMTKESTAEDCYKTNIGKSFDNANKGENKGGVDPDCLDAARTVLKAVYNDTLYNN